MLGCIQKVKKCVNCGRGNEFWYYSQKGLCLECDRIEQIRIKKNNTLEKWIE